MADECTGCKTPSLESKGFVLREADDTDLTMSKLLGEVCTCSNYKKQIDLLAKCVTYIKSCQRSNIEHLLSLEEFRKELICAIDLAIIPSFQAKEYFSYDREDFKKYPEITYYLFSIIKHILCVLASRNTFEVENFGLTNHIENENKCEMKQRLVLPFQDLTFLIPKLMLLIAAHTNCPLWSSMELETLSMEVLETLMFCFSCVSVNEILSVHTYLNHNISAAKVNDNQGTLFKATISQYWKLLSKDVWHQNPFACHSFHWLILQMKLPNLSDCIEQIMAVALNFLEDHQAVNKIKSISCLHHLIENTSTEEMRWLNRAEVIYEKLKNQMYVKEATVVEVLLPCLFDILRVLESPPDLDRHQYILDVLLRETEGENLLVLRKIYIRCLRILLVQVGIYSVRHLKQLVKIAGSYLEVDDGFGEASARPDALKLLESIIRVAWPRIGQHADAILKLSLNFIADINYTTPENDNISNMQSDLTDNAVMCLILLSEVCSDVLPCLRASLRAGMARSQSDSHLFNILNKQLEKIGT